MSAPTRLIAGVAGVAAGELVAAASATVGPTDAVARLVADRLPIAAVELAVFRLHRRDKTALRVTSAAVLAALGAGAVAPGRPLGAARRSAGLAVAVAVIGLRRPPRRPAGAVSVALAQVVAGAVARGLAKRRPHAAAVIAVAGAAVAVTVHGRRRRGEAATPAAGRLPAAGPPIDGAEDWDHATPLITPLDRFHVTDVNFGAPAVDLASWRLRISGEISRPVELDWAGLVELGTIDLDAVLVCIHNRIGWERAANARWQAVPLTAVRDLVGAGPAATHVVTESADGFRISLPVAELDAAGLPASIVVGMNGQPLNAAHGFPARFFVPGLYGQFAGVKWLTAIRFGDHHEPGDWERRGWPPDAVMARSHARIDDVRQVGDTTVITGVAWAPPDGVDAVEISVDGGPWASAELAAAVGAFAWRRWRHRPALAPGRHRIRARAVRGDGQVQDGTARPPFPSGVTGYHEVVVTVGGRERRPVRRVGAQRQQSRDG